MTNPRQIYRMNPLAKLDSNLTQVYDALLDDLTQVRPGFRRWICVESNSIDFESGPAFAPIARLRACVVVEKNARFFILERKHG